MRGRDNVLGSGDGHRALDGAQDRVNGGVQAQSFLDDGLVERQLGEILVGKLGQVGAESLDLLLVEILHNLRVLGEAEHNPGAGGRRGVLAGHEQGNHHVGDLVVGHLDAVLVGRVHQVLHDVELGVLLCVGAALLNGVHVNLSDSALGVVAAAVPGQGSPVQGEVDGGEAHVKVVVEGGERLVEFGADGAALESVRCGEDGDFGHLLGHVDDAGLALEVGVALKVGGDLVGDDWHVRAESLGGQGNLHKLLLLHELGVGAVVDDVPAKDGGREDSVDLLGVDVLELAVEDEVVTGRANCDGGLFSEENKGENVTVLQNALATK